MTSEFSMNSREFSIFERIFMKTSKIHVGHFLRENGMNFREFVFLIFSREFARIRANSREFLNFRANSREFLRFFILLIKKTTLIVHQHADKF